MPTDPFTLVYNRLWELVEATPEFTDMVKVKNRIKLTGLASDPMKNEVNDGDLPEVILSFQGLIGNLHSTSHTTSFDVRYNWVVSTGSRLVDTRLFPLQWALCIAMAKWGTLTALTWSGSTFVKDMSSVAFDAGESNVERNRGITGWSTLWTVELKLIFRTSDLRG